MALAPRVDGSGPAAGRGSSDFYRPRGKPALEFRRTIFDRTAESAADSADGPPCSTGNPTALFPDGLYSERGVLCALAPGRNSQSGGPEAVEIAGGRECNETVGADSWR